MFFISLLSLLVATCIASDAFDATFKTLPSTPIEHELAFAHLAALHGRSYASEEERAKKLSTFKTNVAHIRKLRANSDGRAEFAPNLFFDLSQEEFAAFRMKKRNLVEEAKKIASAPQVVPACLASGVEKKKKKRSDVAKLPVGAPKNFDWRSVQGVVTPVKNQAACGSCWAFSATETLESAWAIVKNVTAPVLAPQQIVDCSVACSKEGNPPMVVCDQGCDGGWPWAAIATLMSEGGQDSEASYPYQGVDGQCAFNPANVLAVPKNYTCISGPDLADDNAMVAALLKYGPSSVAIDASSLQFYISGIITQDWGFCSQTELDHAVQIVGYENRVDLFGYTLPVWIIRNSWSGSWGDSGYFYFERNGNTCGVNSAVTQVIV